MAVTVIGYFFARSRLLAKSRYYKSRAHGGSLEMSEKLHTREQESKPEISNTDSEADSSRRLESVKKGKETLDLNEARTAIEEASPATKENVSRQSG